MSESSLEQTKVALWNDAHPVGTPVIYQPVLGHSATVETRTTSCAWVTDNWLPGGERLAAVMLDGVSSRVPLRHVMALQQPAEPRFFLLSTKHSPMPGPDGLALWWAPHRCGYVTSLQRAGTYTRAEIDPAWEYALVAVPVEEALALSVSVVPWELAREKFVVSGPSALSEATEEIADL